MLIIIMLSVVLLSVVILNVMMLSVIMLSVVRMNVIMLNVATPYKQLLLVAKVLSAPVSLNVYFFIFSVWVLRLIYTSDFRGRVRIRHLLLVQSFFHL